MNRKLIEAAREGDVAKLHNLIYDHPFLLSIIALANGETPLHIACMGGHVDFVREVLNLGPGFVEELNEDGFSPVHIAAARGDVEIVKEFLKVGIHVCLIKGKERRIPLHFAVSRGKINVITELLSACQNSIGEVTARGETCFHLALKNNQFEAFKFLCEHVVVFNEKDILNKKDEQGNTILHLASSRKQYEFVHLLLDNNFHYKDELEVNSLNKKGLTPLDVLISEQSGDNEIEEILTLSGATTSSQNVVITAEDPPTTATHHHYHHQQQLDGHQTPYKKLQNYFKYDKTNESPSTTRNTLLVIAALIVTATYQAVLSPPGGVWQDDFWPEEMAKNGSSGKQPRRHTAGQSVMASHNVVSYGMFLFFNTIGFFLSLHMVDFLTRGLPLQFELRVALFALVATYDACIIAITPTGRMSVLFTVLSFLMPLIMPVMTKVVRDYKRS